MRLLFLYLNDAKYSYRPPLGVFSIMTVLQESCDVNFLALNNGASEPEVIEAIESNNTDCILFSVTTTQMLRLKHYSTFIKERYPEKLIIVGGVHPTICPEDLLDYDIDMVCIGEGERVMLELFEKIDTGKSILDIRNLWIKTERGWIMNRPRRRAMDVNQLPILRRDFIDYQKYLDGHNQCAEFLFTRFCPFDCPFCSNRLLKQINRVSSPRERFRSIDLCLEEIKQVVGKYRVRSIVFDDDIFGFNSKWMKAFLERYRREVGLPFGCNVYGGMLDEGTIGLLKESNCYLIYIGVETGVQNVRYDLLEKRISNKQFIKIFKMARKAGIKRWSYNMVGLPFETLSDVKKSIEFNEELNPDYLQLSVFYPFPKTKSWDICKKHNLIHEKPIMGYFERDSVLYQQSYVNSVFEMFEKKFGERMTFVRYERFGDKRT